MVKRREFLMGTGGATATAALSALAVESLAKDAAPTVAGPHTARPVTNSTANGAYSSKLSTPPAGNVLDPTYIDPRLDSRSISFENPTGARGGGGKTRQGRKGRPFYIFDPGEKVVLADIQGPGTVRHIWTMLSNLPPEVARALRFEVFYDGLSEPSISVPILDFFGLPHGRCAEYYSALVSVNEGRGLNSHIPMPFGRSIRVEFTNESTHHIVLYYQIDYTLEPSFPEHPSYLHATFRRENPTTLHRDFVIAEGLKGPGRFLGCSVGIRLIDKGPWYGEGEVKVYRDGDQSFPTYCGTGLEDYVGSAYGLMRHYGHYSGSPIQIPAPPPNAEAGSSVTPSFVSFYRWHLPDPVMFGDDLRVTIQQIGQSEVFKKGQEVQFEAYKRSHPAAGSGWIAGTGDFLGGADIERSDDYCASAFVYCKQPQLVPRYRTELAVRDIGWLPDEKQSNTMGVSEDELEQFLVEMKKHLGG